jgi:hypothetical protein
MKRSFLSLDFFQVAAKAEVYALHNEMPSTEQREFVIEQKL